MALTPKKFPVPAAPDGGNEIVTPTLFAKKSAKDKPVTPAGAALVDLPVLKFGGVLALEGSFVPAPLPDPTVAITVSPPATATGTIEWAVTGSGVTLITAPLDGVAVELSGDSYTFSDLLPGEHTFTVTVEPGGDTATTVWTVPTPPPPPKGILVGTAINTTGITGGYGAQYVPFVNANFDFWVPEWEGKMPAVWTAPTAYNFALIEALAAAVPDLPFRWDCVIWV